MKKVLSLVLAFIFVFALAIPAFATVEIRDHVDVDADPVQSFAPSVPGESKVEYNVDGNYVVTIPATITLAFVAVDEHVTSLPMQVEASDVLIPYKYELKVAISSDRELVYKSSNDVIDTIEFKIYNSTDSAVGDTEIPDSVVLTVNQGGESDVTEGDGSASAEMYFGVKTTTLPRYNQKYEGIITFTTTVTEYQVQQGA